MDERQKVLTDDLVALVSVCCQERVVDKEQGIVGVGDTDRLSYTADRVCEHRNFLFNLFAFGNVPCEAENIAFISYSQRTSIDLRRKRCAVLAPAEDLDPDVLAGVYAGT